MSAPDHEIVGTATARLRAANTGAGTKVYYNPPADASPPYITVDDTNTRRADGSELRATEVDLTVHVWADSASSGGVGVLQQARAISDEVAEALHGYALPLPTNGLVTLDHRGGQVFYDQDNTIGHGVVQFTAYVDRP